MQKLVRKEFNKPVLNKAYWMVKMRRNTERKNQVNKRGATSRRKSGTGVHLGVTIDRREHGRTWVVQQRKWEWRLL